LKIFQGKLTVLVSKKSPVKLINRLVFSASFLLWLKFESADHPSKWSVKTAWEPEARRRD